MGERLAARVIASGAPDGIRPEPVTAWLAQRVDVNPPLVFDPIEGGKSNLTFLVTDASQRRWVLRRPPLHSVLASAHDMGREYRIVAALQGTEVPVPTPVGFEPDEEVTGAPFHVMDFVDGVVVRDADDARAALDEAGRARAGEALLDVLVALHRIDPDAVGLGDLGRKEDYIARQLRRWSRQLAEGDTRDLPLLGEVHERLAAAIPDQGPAAIVHGDYRLENVILAPDGGSVRAVLDWELCTLGDPLADVGLLMAYWLQPGDPPSPLAPPTTVAGFATRDEVAHRYAQQSGRELGQIDYYHAFGLWKRAVILEGVHSRFASGAYGDVDPARWRPIGEFVVQLAERAAATVGAGAQR